MAKVAVLMADGFEEVEALGVVDILRRAEVDVDTVSIKEEQVVISSRNIPVRADKTLTDMDYYDMIVIPGGAGAWTLRDDDRIISLIKKYDHEERYIDLWCRRAGNRAGIQNYCGICDGRRLSSSFGRDDWYGTERWFGNEPCAYRGGICTTDSTGGGRYDSGV